MKIGKLKIYFVPLWITMTIEGIDCFLFTKPAFSFTRPINDAQKYSFKWILQFGHFAMIRSSDLTLSDEAINQEHNTKK